jgi:hypothetical protein
MQTLFCQWPLLLAYLLSPQVELMPNCREPEPIEVSTVSVCLGSHMG